MVNYLFDDLARLIDEEQGLKKLEIVDFEDEYKLQEWPLSQLVLKSPQLEYLKLGFLNTNNVANRSQLLEFAGMLATNSTCLKTLWIGNTRTTAEDGDMFMQVLADDDINTLQHLNIFHEDIWFEGDRDECLRSLLVLLNRQTALRSLNMIDSKLSDSQQE